jgi:FAD/FMN-containing dehydrogenase
MADGSPGLDEARALAALTQACGPDELILDAGERAFCAADVAGTGVAPLAVIRPTSVAALSAALAAAHAHRLAIHPRGGAMSYTDAFLPQTAHAIVVDTSGLNRILTIDPVNLFATVEAGVTWAQLDAALAPQGLRARFWGPMSGGTATVGGGVSHGAITFGSGEAGAAGGSVLGLTVVLADGAILRTGMDAQTGAAPFFRGYGPDLTGLFCHDCGALGVKAEITLALQPRATHVDGVSFLFDDFAGMLGAMQAISRTGLASEVVGTDSAVMRMGVAHRTFKDDLATGWQVFKAAPDPITGAARLARLALHGRDFFARAAYAAHFVAEADSAAELRIKLERMRRLAGPAAHETSNAMPLALRAMPFPPLPVTAADGRRLAALHAIVPFGAAPALQADLAAMAARHAPALNAARAELMFVFTTLGRNAFLSEPFFYWEDSLTPFLERRSPEALRASWPQRPDNPAARAAVKAAAAECIAIARRHGAGHMQIGRVYPWLADRDPASLAAIRGLKAQFDPQGLMNPGVLGLH